MTRAVLPPDAMIRFVAAPDGGVAPDLRRRLPGRGAWVTATREMVDNAVRARRLERALRLDGRVDPELGARVETLIRAAAVSALSLSRKAGVAIAGFVKVTGGLAQGRPIAVLEAPDGGDDGRAKIESAVRRSPRPAVRIVRELTSEDLGLAFGRSRVIHAALLSGRASDNVLARIDELARYRGSTSNVAEGSHPNDKSGIRPKRIPGTMNDA